MLGLTDNQLDTVMDAARTVPVEKRDLYLQRIAARLALRGRGNFRDADVADAAKEALRGLVQAPQQRWRDQRSGRTSGHG